MLVKKLNFKIKYIAIFFIINSLSFSENVVEFDLNSDTVTSTQGLEINYGDVSLNVLEARRDSNANQLYLDSPFTARLNDPTGRGYLRVNRGDMTLDGKSGNFYNTFGFLEVGRATGAEYPNDKIYYGGDHIQYRDSNIIINNGWVTTDPKVRKTEDPNQSGYHFKSEKTVIEPDKQITLEGIDFYRGDKSSILFPFPWYRANIREGSKVPLFPHYSSGDDDYGFSTAWGFLWGDKDDKYRGGFSPKISDKAGLMVGRMEHWYETDDYGVSKWNMTDTIVDKKTEDTDRRFHNEFSHEYTGKYGTFFGNIVSTTNNMVESLNDRIKDFNALKTWKRLGMKDNQVNVTDRTEFVTLDTDLEGMGERGDISFKGKVKQVTDKDAYDIMLFDEFDDGIATGNFLIGSSNDQINNYGYNKSSLYTDLGLYKDNEDYKLGGYYRNLDDLAPGSSRITDRTREESYGYEFRDKANKIDFSYDKSTRDKYRALTFLELNSDIKPTLFTRENEALGNNLTAQFGDYTVVSIPEYNKYNSENIKFTLGEYQIDNFKSISGYEKNKKENELSFLSDTTRKFIEGNTRDREYNRYTNIIYEDRDEDRVWSSLYNKDYGFTLGGGRETVELHDREGQYNYDFKENLEGSLYKKYKYETEFVDYKLEKKPFDIGELGKFGFYGGGRYDQYTNQSVTGVNENDLASNSNRFNLGLTHDKNIISNSDTQIDNSFKYSYQEYNKNNELLRHNENFHKFEDKVDFGFGKTKGSYGISYDLIDTAGTGQRKNEILKNNVDFIISPKQNLNLQHSFNKRYTEENEEYRNKNDLTYSNYGIKYTLDKHNFSYSKDSIDYDIWKIKNTDNSFEKIDVDTFGYGYTFKNKDKLSLSYLIGKDRRDNYTTGKKEMDTEKNSYGISYYNYGERYDNTYSLGYGKNRYLSRELDTLSSDTYRFGYVFVDKNIDPEFLKIYAMKEYDKEEITSQDLDKIAVVLQERNQQNRDGVNAFDLGRFRNRPEAFTGDFNRKFSLNGHAEKSKSRYEETGKFTDSLESVGFNVGYSQRRVGVGFGYSKEINDEINWSKEDENYDFMLNFKVGKPSESYRITTHGKIERKWYDDKSDLAKTIGVELGKEMGYYEWSVAYYTDFDYDHRKNDWKVALQFTLLTFPDKPIFGIGTSKGAGPNSKASLNSSILSKMD